MLLSEQVLRGAIAASRACKNRPPEGGRYESKGHGTI